MSLSYDDIAKAAQIDRFGAFDYAVPDRWLMVDPEKRRHFCWFYTHKPRRAMFGRPLAYRAIARLALRMMRTDPPPDSCPYHYLQFFAFVHPGKAVDVFGESLITRYLRLHPNLYMARGVQELIRRLGMPWPSPSCLPEKWEDQVAA